MSSGSKVVRRHTVGLSFDLFPGDPVNLVLQNVIDAFGDLSAPGVGNGTNSGWILVETDRELLKDCLAVCFRQRQGRPDHLLDFCNHEISIATEAVARGVTAGGAGVCQNV